MPQLEQYNEHVTQFVPPFAATTSAVQPSYKVGRNEPCPCGPGKKYKKCDGV
ncbi:MAG: SEC-C metal-binding domain-containing protein [Blastocatellia bacterium]